MHRTPHFTLALALCASGALAQNPPLSLSSTVSAGLTLAGKGQSLRFRHSAVGDLDGNLDPDLVFSLGDDVLVFMNPCTSSACFLLGEVATDVEVLPRPGGDLLALAQGQGVAILKLGFDYVATPTTWSIDTRRDVDCGFAVQSLMKSDLDADGDLDLAALAADGRTLVGLIRTGDLWSTASLLTGEQTSAAAWGLVPSQMLGFPALVAMGFGGIEMLDMNGTPVANIPNTQGHCALATLNPAQDQIAWIYPGGSGSDVASLLSVYGLSAGVPIGATAVAIAAGDVDNDLDDDIVIALTDASQLIFAENTGSGFVVSVVGLATGQVTSTDNVAEPVLADLNGDGYTDLAAPDYLSRTLALFFHQGGDLLKPPVYYLNLQGQQSVTWTLFSPEYSGHLTIPPGATHLSTRVYNQVPGAQGWSDPVSDVKPFFTATVRLEGFATIVTFPETGPLVTGSDYATYVEARYVRYEDDGNGNPVLVHKYAPTWFTLVDKDNQAAIDYLVATFGTNVFTEETIGNGESVGGGSGPPPDLPPGPGGG